MANVDKSLPSVPLVPTPSDLRLKGQLITEKVLTTIRRSSSLSVEYDSPRPQRRNTLFGSQGASTSPPSSMPELRRHSAMAERVVQNPEQWAKLRKSIRDKGAVTSISLMHELGDLLQQRVDEMTEPRQNNTHHHHNNYTRRNRSLASTTSESNHGYYNNRWNQKKRPSASSLFGSFGGRRESYSDYYEDYYEERQQEGEGGAPGMNAAIYAMLEEAAAMKTNTKDGDETVVTATTDCTNRSQTFVTRL